MEVAAESPRHRDCRGGADSHRPHTPHRLGRGSPWRSWPSLDLAGSVWVGASAGLAEPPGGRSHRWGIGPGLGRRWRAGRPDQSGQPACFTKGWDSGHSGLAPGLIALADVMDPLIERLAGESCEFDSTARDPERNCWMVVHRHVHGVLPSEYDIREVPEDLYLAVLAARRGRE